MLYHVPKIPSRQTLERYSDLGRAITKEITKADEQWR